VAKRINKYKAKEKAQHAFEKGALNLIVQVVQILRSTWMCGNRESQAILRVYTLMLRRPGMTYMDI
jgi:hypothetical protein